VRSVGVVLLPPGVHRGLQRLDAFKRPMDVEQLALQGLVQPLDLSTRTPSSRLRKQGDA
jgi:hypothetical protein